MPAKPIGMSTRAVDGFQTATPYLLVKNAAAAIEFYKKAFGATELMRPILHPDSGKIVHAEIKIGSSPIMISDEFPEFGTKGPASVGDSTVHIHLYVENADVVADQATAAGAKTLLPVADQPYSGDRSGRVIDPYGHVWIVSTHHQMLSSNDRQEKMKEFLLAPETKAFLFDAAKNPLLGGEDGKKFDMSHHDSTEGKDVH